MFEQAANDYYKRGYLPIPLGLDAHGFPKKPLDDGWTSIERKPETIRGLRWGEAKGLGLVLGPVSGNLAAVDVDDVELAEAIYQRAKTTGVTSRMVRTIRKRLHLYVIEAVPSRSRRYDNVHWNGHSFTVELKAQGTQVAAPPTPGYELLFDVAPVEVPNIEAAWLSIAHALGVEMPEGNGGYPRPWQPAVPQGQRNGSAYIEAHKLREAGMPLEQALEVMRLRVEAFYAPGDMRIEEALATVRSAYRKGVVMKHKFLGGVPVVLEQTL